MKKKFPSIIRLPNYKRFHFEPRYYDPIKEDIENRTALIRSELKREAQMSNGHASKARISAAFRKNVRQQEKKSFMLQILIAGLLIAVFVMVFTI